jgi:hypothetical protein
MSDRTTNEGAAQDEAPHDEVVNSLMDLQARLRGEAAPEAPLAPVATALEPRAVPSGSDRPTPGLPSPPEPERLRVVHDDLQVTTETGTVATPGAATAQGDVAEIDRLSALFRRLDTLESSLSVVDRRLSVGETGRRDVEQRLGRVEAQLHNLEEDIATAGTRVAETVTADVRAQFEDLRRTIAERLAELADD